MTGWKRRILHQLKPSATSFGETIIVPDTSVTTSRTLDDDPDVELTPSGSAGHPRSIGRYRIVSVLGKGGFGVVYRAHDPQLDRDVAIKMPLIADDVPKDRREEILSEFLQEARRLARLSHPGIVSNP